jgi:multidrug efflux pump subunit AcrA (membrane-fusion protein)
MAALAKARKALKAADAALEKAQKAAKGKKTPALAAAEKKQKAAAAAVEKATPPPGASLSRVELEKKVAEARDAVAAAKASIASASIFAPASGVLTLIELEKGKTVARDAKLAVVEDVQKLKAVVKVPAGEALKKGMGVVLVLPSGNNKRVLFDADATGDVAEAEFDNAKGEFIVGSRGDANIEAAERSLVSR